MDYQEKQAVLIRAKKEEGKKREQEYSEKLSVFGNKLEKLNDAYQANERSPRTKVELIIMAKAARKEAIGRTDTLLVEYFRQAQTGKGDLFGEAGLSLGLGSERNLPKWVPRWLTEKDIEDAFAQLEETAGAISQRDRESRREAILKEIAETEKAMEKLGS